MFFRNLRLVLAFTSVSSLAAQSMDGTLAKALRKEDERLLMAVHRGDKAAWAEVTTPDFMYVEDGEVSPRKEFLNDLEEDGLAPLVIEQYEVQRLGNTAIVKHLDGLSSRKNADVSRSKFLFLETWQQVGGEWKLRLIHVDRLRVNPTPIALTPLQMQALVGSYRSGADRYIIRLEGDQLYGARVGATEQRLLAETPDVLFVPENFLLRKIFRFNHEGQSTEFIDRNVAIDRIWTREPMDPVSPTVSR